MRDHLIHAYDTVDWDEVWNAATVDVPRLVIQLSMVDDTAADKNTTVDSSTESP